MTLLDFPGKVACTVFTGGCNLRCPFCHNAKLVTDINADEQFSADEVLRFLSKRTGLLDGVCITGGEPLLQADIKDFIIMIKKMGFKLKLDTNGFYPAKLIDLIESGLIDYAAVDIKNSDEKYDETVGVKNIDLAPLNASIDYLCRGKIDFEFRTTVVAEFHTENDIEKIAVKINRAKKYFLQNFVDSGNLIGENLHAADEKTLAKMLEIAQKHIPDAKLRGI